ncbi:MAG: DUF3604 domain-containing protein [Myxococcota bacterium]
MARAGAVVALSLALAPSIPALAALGLLAPATALADASSASPTASPPAGGTGTDPEGPRRRLLFGDTHLHTSYSFDAFLNGNRSADPDTAYRWAKGLPVIHPYHRARVRIETPLDFLVVADHAEYLGIVRKLYFDVREGPGAEFAARVREAVDGGKGRELFSGVLPSKSTVSPGDTRDPISAEGAPNALPVDPATAQLHVDAWAETTTAADRHNDPGRFTTLIGWEWSSLPSGANLHRVVLTDADGETARRFLPYGSDQSSRPEDLWSFLERTRRETGAEFVAIPHNSNISKGYMFGEVTLDESPYTPESARTRARWEPVVEVTQFKGTSETHPALSPDDPFAGFEIYGAYIQQNEQTYAPQQGDYVRTGLMRGLEIEERVGVNPYKFGLIGSTDSHTGLSTAEEDNFWGKFAFDSTPETKGRFAGGRGVTGWNMGASGLAAVWAEENTRDAIFAAFRRREVYATTGTRLRVRFFGGWRYAEGDAEVADLAAVGYAKGVPMGGDLAGRPPEKRGLAGLFGGERAFAPSFLVHAAKDPKGANLDRIQIVKGWIGRDGRARERVFDVVWAGPRVPGENGALPPIGSSVDLDRGTYANTIGAPELAAVWRDPDFDPGRRAFYYVRVLEIPTPRHSLLDGIALQTDPPDEQPPTLQERAYTSPIWYTP